METKDLDLVLWGATGFTGKLAVAYLLGDQSSIYSFKCSGPAAPSGLKWAVCGRNKQKLESLNAGVEIIVCDADDKVGIEKFVKRAKVVAGFAGPFVKYSDFVVEACCNHGTHWVDITGEVAWSRWCSDRWNHKAIANGACIVNHCGYDSIPSDLGTLFAVNTLRSRVSSPIRSVINYQIGLGGFSGGSLQTGLAGETHPVNLSNGVDPDDLFLVGGEPRGGPREEDRYLTNAYFDSELGEWIGPFGMANINSRVVRRSNMLLEYGQQFGYREVQVCLNEKQARKAEALALQPTPPEVLKKLIEAGKLPKPGEGPSPSLRSKSRFLSLIVATNEAGNSVAVTVNGGECGYEETAKMCVEAALSLVYESSTCANSKGGFLTPSSCMGTTLINRLHLTGIKFSVLSDPEPKPAKELGRDAILAFRQQVAKL